MESNLTCKGQSYTLVEEFIDVGYMAEDFEAKTIENEKCLIKRSNPQKAMSLFVSFPFVCEELLKLDELLSHVEVPLVCYLICKRFDASLLEFSKKLKKFQLLEDSFEEFGLGYGTKIENLEEVLAKALFLISKDGAVFYIDFLQDLQDSFNLERLRVELNRAYITYTGVGCHG
ncbi:MAG TPA: hypothetical protein CFH82_00270 [Sulfurospirillum sp. UBA12182]|jgi:peroxiredoxin|nr:MAG TPA: hypothetical protein CFH82_00270 [Sulfurospirillum sp. UBA12182]